MTAISSNNNSFSNNNTPNNDLPGNIETKADKKKVVVIGNGMVGHKFIEYLVAQKQDDVEVLTFSEEPSLAYDRVQLSSYFSGQSIEDLSMTDEINYEKLGIKFHLNDKVLSIDKKAKDIITQRGVKIDYDKLILATGSTPFVPPIPGGSGDHIHVYRTIWDLDGIRKSSKDSKTGVVIGGGLLGLEAANALTKLNLKTSVVEFAPQLMPVQLDKNGGRLLRDKIEELGVEVLTKKIPKK